MDVMDAGQLKSIRSMKRLGSLKKSQETAMSIWAMSFKRFDKGRNTPCSLQKCQIWVGLRLRPCSDFWANWVPGSPILKSPHPGLRQRSVMCDVYMILVRTSFELKTSSVSSAHSFVAKISSPQSSPPCAPPATSCLLLPELQIQCKWTFWGIESKRASRSFVLCETMQAEGERERGKAKPHQITS